MSILKIVDLGDVSTIDQHPEVSFESSLDVGTSLDRLVDLRNRVVARGTVCRQDAMDMSDISNEHQIIKNHLLQTPTGMYTECLSKINLNETVLTLESAVSKSVLTTIGDVSQYISTRASSAMQYISDIFDDEVIANKNALRVMIMVEYANTVTGVIKATKLSGAIGDVTSKGVDSLATEWSDLKTLINDPKADLDTLVGGLTNPVINHYPDLLKAVMDLLEALDKSKTSAELTKALKSIKLPTVGYGSLVEWVKRRYPNTRYVKVEGSTPFQVAAVHARDLLKQLSTSRQGGFKIKADELLKSGEYIPRMTSQVAAERALKSAKSTTDKYTGDLSRLGKVAQKLVLNDSYETTAMPVILEILSLVRGFTSLEESIGILAMARRELIGNYMQTMSKVSADLHGLVASNAGNFTVSQVKEINDATIKLKASLAEV